MSTAIPVAAAPLPNRLWAYQRERFPLAAYLPLIGLSTLSAAAYSSAARGAPGLPDGAVLILGAATVLVFFFMLRVLDEHKDAAVDRRYRSELPVPRGLVTLSELRWVGGGALLLVVVGNLALAPALIFPLLLVVGWAVLMTREFFAPEWLRARPGIYLLSHMIILPLIFGYATALDWLAVGVSAPQLGMFLCVAFLNGILIELGRKIRAPEEEREGVDTYTHAWGTRAAPTIWLAALAAAALAAHFAAQLTGAATATTLLLPLLLLPAALPTIGFLRTATPVSAKRIETASGLWTLSTYLLLGFGPYLFGS